MSSAKSRSRNHLQLFNISHKNDLLKLFKGLKTFQLNANTEEDDEQEDNSKGLDEDFLSEEEDIPVPDLPKDTDNEFTVASIKDGKVTCTTCDISFTDLSEHRCHYHLDWHRYNLKRKLCGQPPVTEIQFTEIMDDLSSIEGSDDEDGEAVDVPLSRLLEKVELGVSNAIEKKQPRSVIKLGNSPKMFFENCDGEIFSVFKSTIKGNEKSETVETSNDVSKVLPSFLTNPPLWAIIMVSGGHFAAAVFESSNLVLHKTFHSYTVRAKQGGSQGSQDSKSGTSHPKSAGASLRRYNEASFTKHIQDLLESWKDKLSRCSRIFVRAASSSSNSLFGGKTPILQRSDPKIRNVPFPSMRPTLKEVKRVHSILSGVHIYGSREEFIAKHLTPKNKTEDSTRSKKSKRKKGNIDIAKSRSPVKRDEPERPLSSPELGSEVEFTIEESNEEISFSHLEEYGSSLTSEEIRCRKPNRKPRPKKNKDDEFPIPRGIVGDLMSSISSDGLPQQLDDQLCGLQKEYENRKNDPSFLNEVNQHINAQSHTILHLVAAKGLQNAIWSLLECGCNPAIKDKSGKYPYNYAETKESRMVFRKFRGQYADKYDYDKAQIPVPLSEEQEQEKLEKKRALSKLKREKEKMKKLEKKEKEKETNEKDRFLNLSDREKRALAAERRILGSCKRNGEKAPILIRCFECATDITGKVPFEYNSNVFCSSKCLVVHRKKFPTDLTA